MILLPAIDLYEGKVVRLTRGDYGNMTVYRDDPAAQAAEFQAAGAAWLHTVDLEGARDGMLGGTNVALYQGLSRQFDLDLIASGGVSSIEDLQQLKEIGLYGAILGKALYTGALELRRALREVK